MYKFDLISSIFFNIIELVLISILFLIKLPYFIKASIQSLLVPKNVIYFLNIDCSLASLKTLSYLINQLFVF